ncbi:MAG: GTPase, partial [Candidatus Sumerlaeota bacterium]
GFVALLGSPNVGKSTLLNAILDFKLAIVSPKAQTTRDRIHGIYSDSRRQIVFTDTPGVMDPHDRFNECLREEVGTAFDPETLKKILLKVSELYFDCNVFEGPADVELSPEDHKALVNFINEKMREKFKKGVGIRSDSRIRKGFRISLRDKDLYHDFTQDAIADELSDYLRPEMQKIVRKVTDESDKSGKES